MKLKPKEPTLKTTALALRVPGAVYADLTNYAVHYQAEYGAAITLRELVIEMLRSFMESDGAFRAWKKKHGDAHMSSLREIPAEKPQVVGRGQA